MILPQRTSFLAFIQITFRRTPSIIRKKRVGFTAYERSNSFGHFAAAQRCYISADDVRRAADSLLKALTSTSLSKLPHFSLMIHGLRQKAMLMLQ